MATLYLCGVYIPELWLVNSVFRSRILLTEKAYYKLYNFNDEPQIMIMTIQMAKL